MEDHILIFIGVLMVGIVIVQDDDLWTSPVLRAKFVMIISQELADIFLAVFDLFALLKL